MAQILLQKCPGPLLGNSFLVWRRRRRSVWFGCGRSFVTAFSRGLAGCSPCLIFYSSPFPLPLLLSPFLPQLLIEVCFSPRLQRSHSFPSCIWRLVRGQWTSTKSAFLCVSELRLAYVQKGEVLQHFLVCLLGFLVPMVEKHTNRPLPLWDQYKH